MMNKFLNSVIHSKRFVQSRIILGLDIILSLFSSTFVLLLIGLLLPSFEFSGLQIAVWLAGAVVTSFTSFRIFKVYRAIIRYATLRELGRIFSASIGKEILLWLIMAAFSIMSFKSLLLLGMTVMDFFITLCSLSLIRVWMVILYDKLREMHKTDSGLKRILVYGTGDNAAGVVASLRNSAYYRVVGFLSHGEKVNEHRISGLDVCFFKSEEDLREIKKRYAVSGILFPDVSDARLEQDRLISFCKDTHLKTYIIPGVDEMTEGATPGNYVRKIKIEDLLGRDEIKISMNEIVENFNNKTVMVTGAAGSIGSELCRQLATLGVKQLILFDNAETPLHNIRLELEDRFPELNFVPVIGDVRSEYRLDYVFRKHHPQIVFHAAAYKHVPLMEENPCEAVWVNVTGSRQVADKCVEYGAEKMVMVSTDKAVNPTNIMGCTKRLAEIYVQSLGLAIEKGEIEGKTKFVTTRFGNVLGSNGSVIPRFREQIEHGGPVTVTHPEITRFFMTIPEACRLVMEAATFASGTQIFVFDMGESVRIATLAERMIRLAGLEPGRDIRIEFTGLRPGEKLYEEVLATKENTLPTCHDRIFIAKAREYAYTNALDVVTALTRQATSISIPEMVRLMKQTVPEFKSKNSEYEIYDKEISDTADNS